MGFKVELPEGTLLVNEDHLKRLVQEVMAEVQRSNGKDEIMTIREAAEYLKVSVPTVRTMIANKEIPYFQRGQVIRLNLAEVKAWMRCNSNQKERG
ncbi:DNA binding domain-containing protein, excisionase family [Fictibacillus enclensis]|uniref:DNA-binding protein n=1 Tax=Fictibacillus enclensis TaxID=1017270 RepID=A0A0V8IUQ7_9BACL|nr:DNA-binding protein [Fictibacillus enclensis]SCC40899.1 DNA binding domain-containing protein, excisionase family [Fictibacillus enclensis]